MTTMFLWAAVLFAATAAVVALFNLWGDRRRAWYERTGHDARSEAFIDGYRAAISDLRGGKRQNWESRPRRRELRESWNAGYQIAMQNMEVTDEHR